MQAYTQMKNKQCFKNYLETKWKQNTSSWHIHKRDYPNLDDHHWIKKVGYCLHKKAIARREIIIFLLNARWLAAPSNIDALRDAVV